MAKVKDLIKDEIKKEATIAAIEAATHDLVGRYTESPYHTNAGKVLRFLAKRLPVNFIIKILQARVNG
jgi:outer membrane protein assembly factor BamD (BamD/ComL family)